MKLSQNIPLINCRIPDYLTAMRLVSRPEQLKSIDAQFDYSSLQKLKDDAKMRYNQLYVESLMPKEPKKNIIQKIIDFLNYKL